MVGFESQKKSSFKDSKQLNIGKLRYWITIEQVSETQDTDGSVIEVWPIFATVRGAIEPKSGREYFAAQSTQAEVPHRINLRYRSGINSKLRVNYNSKIFDILSVINIGERKRELRLMCREIIA